MPAPPFDALLDQLRDAGFAVNVDRVLRIERLLELHGASVPPPRLKHLLRPLLASSEEQQTKFDLLYDRFFALPASVREPPKPPEHPLPWIKIAAAAGVVALAGMAVFFVVPALYRFDPPPPPAPPKVYSPPNAVLRTSPVRLGQRVQLDSSWSTSFLPVPLSARWNLRTPPGSRARLDAANSFMPDVPGEYEVSLTVHDGASPSRPAVGILTPTPSEDKDAFVLPKVEIRWDDQVNGRSIDFRWLWLLLIPGGVATAVLGRKFWIRRKIIDRVRQLDFSRKHEIRELTLGDTPGPVAVRSELRALRRPLEGPARMHAAKSVAATVKAGGYPVFVYQNTLRRASYLVLIDTLSTRDHQSRHFQEFVREMHRAGLDVDAYLFAGDPRVCRPIPGVARGTRNVLLADLVHKAAGSRLLVFGDGSRLLFDGSTELQPWTEMFRQWSHRALITPRAANSEWTGAERALQELFLVLPAREDSIRAFLDLKAPESAYNGREPAWEYATAEELEAALGLEAYRWLSACALYPRLEWVLTQRLGRELGFFSQTALLRLIRLPWFRHGELPLELADRLVERMPASGRKRARMAMERLLEEAAANEAGDSRGTEFEIAVQQLDLSPGERQRLRRDMAVARGRRNDERSWLLRLPARLGGDSTWLAERARPLAALAVAMALAAGVGALGKQADMTLARTYQGPGLPDPFPVRQRPPDPEPKLAALAPAATVVQRPVVPAARIPPPAPVQKSTLIVESPVVSESASTSVPAQPLPSGLAGPLTTPTPRVVDPPKPVKATIQPKLQIELVRADEKSMTLQVRDESGSPVVADVEVHRGSTSAPDIRKYRTGSNGQAVVVGFASEPKRQAYEVAVTATAGERRGTIFVAGSRGVYTRVEPATASGVAESNDSNAAREYARYSALEKLAQRAVTDQRRDDWDAAIEYLGSQSVRIERPESEQRPDGMTRYTLEYSIPATALDRALQVRAKRNPFILWGSNSVTVARSDLKPEPIRRVVPLMSSKATLRISGKAGKFFDVHLDLTSSPGGRTMSVELIQIDVFSDGSRGSTRWSFEVLVNGRMALTVPNHRYDDERKPTAYRTAAPDRRRVEVPVSDNMTIQVNAYSPR